MEARRSREASQRFSRAFQKAPSAPPPFKPRNPSQSHPVSVAPQEKTWRTGDSSLPAGFDSPGAKSGFTFLSGLNKKSNVLWHMKVIWNSDFSSRTKFYWNSATLIPLHFFLWLLCPTVAELNSCNRDRMAYETEKIFCLALHRGSLPSPDLSMWSREAMRVGMVLSGVAG